MDDLTKLYCFLKNLEIDRFAKSHITHLGIGNNDDSSLKMIDSSLRVASLWVLRRLMYILILVNGPYTCPCPCLCHEGCTSMAGRPIFLNKIFLICCFLGDVARGLNLFFLSHNPGFPSPLILLFLFCAPFY